MSLTPLPPPPRPPPLDRAPLVHIFCLTDAVLAVNGSLPAELKFRENT